MKKLTATMNGKAIPVTVVELEGGIHELWLDELRMLLETIRNLHPDIEDYPEWIAACESGAMNREYYPPV